MWLILSLLACQANTDSKPVGVTGVDSPLGTTPPTTEADTDSDSDTDTDTDTDSDTDTDTDSDTDSDTGTDPVTSDDTAPIDDSGPTDDSGGSTPVVRFVALGDAGEGNSEQYAVSDVIETVCAAQGCDFALYLGDNFYNSGVDSVDDAQFEEKFELPYANLDFPFYVVLGNHDYGLEGAGLFWWQADYQVEYTYSGVSNKWNLPESYYDFTFEHVAFYGLDTNAIFWGFYGDQQLWLDDALAASTSDWNIAFGHHPYISNGDHGNAGAYEGFEWLPIANGESVEEFMDASICGQVDVYICGHDHSRQDLEETCGTQFLVSGAGAKTTEVNELNPYWYESDYEGFMWVQIEGNELTLEFWDMDGNLNHTRSYTK